MPYPQDLCCVHTNALIYGTANKWSQIWELAQGAVSFDGTWDTKAQYTTEAHLAQMTAILGSFPKELLNRSSRSDQYFDEHGAVTQARLKSDGVLTGDVTFP